MLKKRRPWQPAQLDPAGQAPATSASVLKQEGTLPGCMCDAYMTGRHGEKWRLSMLCVGSVSAYNGVDRGRARERDDESSTLQVQSRMYRQW